MALLLFASIVFNPNVVRGRSQLDEYSDRLKAWFVTYPEWGSFWVVSIANCNPGADQRLVTMQFQGFQPSGSGQDRLFLFIVGLGT